MKLERWMPGYYRISGETAFAGILCNRDDHMWYAEIHDSRTGTLVRYAGIWKTLKDAAEESRHLLERYYG